MRTGVLGRALRADYHYRFESAAAAQAHRETWLTSKHSRAAEQRSRAEKRRESGQLLAVGDVLVASWGYEQTNYDYYQVTRKVGTRSVEIRELAKDKTDNGVAMTGECVPIKGLRIPLIADTHSKLIADSVPDDRGHPQWGA